MVTLRHILLVSDESRQLSELELTLRANREAPREITVANGGGRALDLLRTRCFDLVITDLMMLEHDGIDVIRTSKALDPHAKIIVLADSRSGERQVYARIALLMGAEKVLEKPIAAELVAAVADSLLGGSGRS